MKIGDAVDTGACVGKITRIENKIVTVEGTYYYSEGGGEEKWKLKYFREDLEKCPRDERQIINASEPPPGRLAWT